MKKNKIKAAPRSVRRKSAAPYRRHHGRQRPGGAKKRLLPRSVGHRYGMDRMMGLLRHALDVGVNYVTVYALSTENFSRPQKELDCLFDLIRNHFVPCMREIAERKARVRVIGDLSLFPSDVQKLLLQAQEESAMYEGRGVNVALGYGSRAEIARAAEKAAEKAKSEGRSVTERDISEFLYTAGLPIPISSSAREKSSGFPTSCSGKAPMRNCIFPIKCSRIFPIKIWTKH